MFTKYARFTVENAHEALSRQAPARFRLRISVMMTPIWKKGKIWNEFLKKR